MVFFLVIFWVVVNPVVGSSPLRSPPPRDAPQCISTRGPTDDTRGSPNYHPVIYHVDKSTIIMLKLF